MQIGRAESDGDLPARFVKSRDEAAFTVLVERHGAMVLGVCRRALEWYLQVEELEKTPEKK